ncbi:MAG: hypothetical protein ABWY68_03580 [Cryobacterium sp.]
MSATDATRTAEFDAFGPWVDEVHDATEVPALYRDHPVDFATSHLVLKVPRNISRRDALPTMHLYDHLIVVAPAALTVLSRAGDNRTGDNRTGDSYTESSIGYGDIAVIEDSVDLVDGRLGIHTRAGTTLTVPYNGSSQQVITRLTDVLRDLASAAAGSGATRDLPHPDAPPAALDLLDLGKQDVGLVTSYFDLLRHEPDAALLAAHGRIALAPSGGLVSRVLHAVRPMTLHGAVVCRTERELQIVGRRHWLVRGKAPELSRALTTIPLAAIDAITLHPHPKYLAASVVTFALGALRYEAVLPTGSPAERLLAG